MIDKFIVVDCMGIKQVGFENEDGAAIFSPDALVSMLNTMNTLNKKLEQRVEGQLKALESAGKYIQALEEDLDEVKYFYTN